MSYKRTHKYMKMVEESAKKIEDVTDASFRALARAIDAKDKYTQGHSLRVAYYSSQIAKRLGKSKNEQNDIYKAALLHDIGKIRIPDEIINKPGALTDEEYDCIKLHTVAGYNILKDISEDPTPALCAKWHHERYDGRGYPSGIRKDHRRRRFLRRDGKQPQLPTGPPAGGCKKPDRQRPRKPVRPSYR